MTEEEWFTGADPEEMYFQVIRSLGNSRRRMDLFCLACANLVRHLIHDKDAARAFEWLEEHPGQRPRPERHGSRRHVFDLFQYPAQELYEAHHRREQGVGGRAVHVAYDIWANWYEYAFPNLCELFADYPDMLPEDPRISLSAIIRDIFGNPFRPVAFNSSWRTTDAVGLARSMYDSRDFSPMPILSDALEDAGCDNADILAHCRGDGPHVRGCWVVDLVLGKN